jgi:hypothetical protein
MLLSTDASVSLETKKPVGLKFNPTGYSASRNSVRIIDRLLGPQDAHRYR